MLVDFENIDYIKVCPETHTLQIPDCYIPASTWGFIMGDITEQKDLMGLINNIEIGITPEQIALLQNVEKEINEINNSLDMKVDVGKVYTKSEIDNKGYLTEHQSLTNYYTKNEVDKAIENVEVDLTGYATEQWVKEQNYLTEHQSLTNYYTKTEVDNKIDNIEVDVDLTEYATKSYVDAAVEAKVDSSDIWTGTQDEWDAMTTEIQNSYIIAMIQQ
jgi:hypothetical protein